MVIRLEYDREAHALTTWDSEGHVTTRGEQERLAVLQAAVAAHLIYLDTPGDVYDIWTLG
jgi:hypothetical protein